jgi:hypothetical protein
MSKIIIRYTLLFNTLAFKGWHLVSCDSQSFPLFISHLLPVSPDRGTYDMTWALAHESRLKQISQKDSSPALNVIGHGLLNELPDPDLSRQGHILYALSIRWMLACNFPIMMAIFSSKNPKNGISEGQEI